MDKEASLRLLVEAFLWPLLFFETCPDDVLDPDIAVEQMEQIASALQALEQNHKTEVRLILEQIASEVTDAKTKSLILDVPRSIGWLDEDE